MWGLSALALVVPLFLDGCGNALLFYETGKLSLTLEARPDSSQPVQGNLGFKQRSAVVAPPKSRGNLSTDAGSMISSFRVTKEEDWRGWGPLTVQTTLVTGRAASELNAIQAGRVARAVAGVPTYVDIAAGGIAAAERQGKRERLGELTAKDWPALSDAEKTELGGLTDTFSQYDEALHSAIRQEMEE
jgi:hypothetical protein